METNKNLDQSTLKSRINTSIEITKKNSQKEAIPYLELAHKIFHSIKNNDDTINQAMDTFLQHIEGKEEVNLFEKNLNKKKWKKVNTESHFKNILSKTLSSNEANVIIDHNEIRLNYKNESRNNINQNIKIEAKLLNLLNSKSCREHEVQVERILFDFGKVKLNAELQGDKKVKLTKI